jgi:plasmid stabilization system protein ParE
VKSVRFLGQAARDLTEIRTYYEAYDPRTLDRVLDDIERTIDLLRLHPLAGQPVDGRAFRRIVTRRYAFKIAYDVVDNATEVIGLYRFQDRQR